VTGILILIVIVMVLLIRIPPEAVVIEVVTETRTVEEIEKSIQAAVEKIRALASLDLESGGETEDMVQKEIDTLKGELVERSDPLRIALIRDIETARGDINQLKLDQDSLEQKQLEANLQLKEMAEKLETRDQFIRENGDTSQVWLRKDPAGKEPIILELSSSGAALRDINDPKIREIIGAGELETRLRLIASGHERADSYFVFFIRPSGAEHVEKMSAVIEEEGYKLGYRPLAEDAELKIYSEDLLNLEQ